jgi:probable HAF family extracellular repeat protein
MNYRNPILVKAMTLLMSLTAITMIAPLAIPARLAAQGNQGNHKHHHYKVIDIGTFGGPESFVIPTFEIGSPNPLNSRGSTVGGAGNSVSTNANSNPIECGGIEGSVPFVSHAFELKKNGAMTDLGSLAGDGACSLAPSINERGEIAGSSENGVLDPGLGLNEVHAVRWENGSIQDLGTLGGNQSMAAGINDQGQVVGWALNGISDPLSIYDFQIFGSISGTQTRAFLWQNGVMHDLGTLGGPDAWGDLVNTRGQVAGFSYTDSNVNPVTGVPTTHPFLWEEGEGMTDLGTLGGTSAGSEIANMQGALNNLGHIVGGSLLSGDQIYHPFFWKKGKPMRDLGTLGGNCGTATGINDADDVVGRADVSGLCGTLAPSSATNASHAFLWKPGMKKLRDIGTVNGDTNSYADAINNSGQVVGQSATEDAGIYQAFLWENGGPMVDLNALIAPNSSLYLNKASAINDRGEIAGIGTPPECSDGFPSCGHAFVLIPCDENHAGIEGCDYSMVEGSAAVSQTGSGTRNPSSQGVTPPFSKRDRLSIPFRATGSTN